MMTNDLILLLKNAVSENDVVKILNLDAKICRYIGLLEKWNSVHNILSKNTSQRDILEHVVDCVLGAESLQKLIAGNIVDVGSGGGLPGVVLAILFPGAQVTLIEASRKKCSFLRLVKGELSLLNMRILNQRVEAVDPSEVPEYALITSRAAFSPGNIHLVADLVKNTAKLILWATPGSEPELTQKLAPNHIILQASERYVLPCGGKSRTILVYGRK
jgi:16S rRNA (guanine527-N7)-methyltransferase